MTVIKPVEYRTQSIDSSFEAEQVQFKLWRNLSASEKELLLKRVTKRGAMSALAGIKGQFPTASKEIIRDYYIRKRLGDKWANLLSGLKYQGEVYTCYFNNQGEPCTVRWVPGGAYQVTWLRDGRVVTYSFFDCVGIPEYGMARCQVGIVEDNGRLSAGVAMLGKN